MQLTINIKKDLKSLRLIMKIIFVFFVGHNLK